MSNPVRMAAIAVVVVAAGYGAYAFLGNKGGSDADALVIQLGNNSYDTLTGLEISSASANSYTPVNLTDGKLTAGQFYELTIAGGASQCKYDLRFTKEGGEVQNRNGVDLCAQTYYHFADQ